jgi:hypothetical protein
MYEDMILTQLSKHYELHFHRTDARIELENLLVEPNNRSDVIRTKLECLETFIEAAKGEPSLVKVGPSCVNI